MGRPVKRRAAPSARRSETSIHLEVVRFLRLAWPGDLPWWHTPNGELRDKAVAGKLMAMGLRPGVPDLTFILPNGQAAFIELKIYDGVLSLEQGDFRLQVVALRCAYATCRSVDDVERIITKWLAAFGRAPTARLTVRAAA